MRCLFAGLLVLLPGVAALAQTAEDRARCRSPSGDTGTVADIVDGDTMILTDGRVVRMIGVEAPKPHLAPPGTAVDALAEAAQRRLRALAGGKTVALRPGAPQRDRHGRILAQLYLEDGTWLQRAMVAAGMARIRPFADDFSCLDGLRDAERAARDGRRGLWRHKEFSVISAYDSSLIKRKGLYVLVEGRVLSVGHGNRVDFVNFGHNWRRDFTVLVSGPLSARMANEGMPIDAAVGKWVRVRGIVEERGGPAIWLRDPGEIEILDDD